MIRLLIVASIRFYRESLAELLARESWLSVDACVAGGAAALDHLKREPADIILVDATAPEALTDTQVIAHRHPTACIVVVGVMEQAGEVIRWAQAGACSYVSRDASVSALLGAIRGAAIGELRCSPEVTGEIFRCLGQAGSIPRWGERDDARLTPREREIAAMVVAGMSNKALARRLGIRVATAKNHVHNILQKLHATDRSQIRARLGSHGVVDGALRSMRDDNAAASRGARRRSAQAH